MEYPELLDKEIELALKRNREENNMVFSFDTNVLEGYANGSLKGGKGKLELQGRSLKFKYYVTLIITVKGNKGSFLF